jgi:hyperosmotically inducible protein
MKTTFLATLLATAVSASFAAAPTAALNHDPATYNNVTKKAAADYKAATAKCTAMTGNAKTVCTEEAKAARAHAEVDAVAQYNNTPAGRVKARTAVANADFSLAKAKCGDMTGADKDACMANATSVHTAAVADAKSDRALAANAADTTTSGDATKAAAIDKCAQVAGQPKTGCLIDNAAGNTRDAAAGAADRTRNAAAVAADKTRNAAAVAADKTRNAASTVVEKTKEVASTAVDKTKEVASSAADKTRNATAVVAGKTDRATDRAADTGSAATQKTGAAVADSVITTKVKADIFKEPELKSMAIHVETEKGVVMLSGFVDSKADADKAVRLAKGVDGVSNVKSAIKVK